MRVEGRAVRKQFGRIEALRGIDFTIPSGEKVGLIGPNASGKSTLIRIILRLLQCQGELLLDGEFRAEHVDAGAQKIRRTDRPA